MIAYADRMRRQGWFGPPPPAGGWFGPLAAAGSSDALALTPFYGAGVDGGNSAAGTQLTLHAHFSRVAISMCDPNHLMSATRARKAPRHAARIGRARARVSRAAAARSDRAHRRPRAHRTPPPRTAVATAHRRRAPPPRAAAAAAARVRALLTFELVYQFMHARRLRSSLAISRTPPGCNELLTSKYK